MSTLLEQASLVMIPSGYKEDIVYSQIPTNGNGDLSFTRASNGTRVNSAGLVEVVPWNLIEDSENFGVNAVVYITIGSNVTTAPNGTTTADSMIEDGTNNLHAVYDFGALTYVAGVYTLSCYVKKGIRDWVRIQFYDGVNTQSVWANVDTGVLGTVVSPATASIESVGNGWYRINISTAMLSGTGGWAIYATTSDGGTTYTGTNGATALYLWGLQINIGSTAKPYFPTTDRLNVPRLTYQNGGGGCPSLLLEKQSTNLLKYSEQFDDSNWTKDGAIITANTTISPDGTQNADTLTGASGNYRIYQIVGGLSSIDYTFSVFAKKGTANLIWLDFINVGDGPSFNFTTKAWSSASGWVTSYEEHANGWYRLIATKASNTTSAGLGIKVGAVNETVYLWGAQMEASSYKTSYIGTTSSSATRVADACSKTGISSLIGQTEGTIFVDLVITGTTGNNRFSISDGSNANWIFIGTPEDGATRASRFYIKTDNSVHVDVGVSSYFTIGQRYKLALAYKSGDWAVYGNGTLLYSGTNPIASVSSALSVFNFFNATSGNADCGEQINQAILFPTRLTNSELASLTTI